LKGGAIANRQVRCFEAKTTAEFRGEQRIEQARRKQGTFNGPRWFAGVDHFLDALKEKAEMAEGTGFLRPE
jgi:hypothetical protein